MMFKQLILAALLAVALAAADPTCDPCTPILGAAWLRRPVAGMFLNCGGSVSWFF
jgi:hypothetical protein